MFPKIDREVAVLFFVTFFVGMSVSLMAPLLPVIRDEFSLSYTLVSLVFSAFGIARLLLALPSGYLYHHASRRTLLLAGVALMSASALITGLSSSFVQLIASQLLMGAGFSLCITTIVISLSLSTTRKNRGSVMGMNTFARSLAAVIGPAVSGILILSLGWRSVFFLYAIMTGAAALFIAAFIKKEQAREAGDTVKKRSGTKLRHMLLTLFLVSFLAAFTTVGFKNNMVPLYSKDVLHADVATISVILSLMALVHMATSPAAAVLSDRYGRRIFLLSGLAATVMGTFLFLFVSGLPLLIVAAVLLGFGTVIFVMPVTIIGDITPPEHAGRNYGIQRFLTDLGFVVGPLSLGYVADVYGFTAVTWLTGLLSLAVLALAVLFVKEPIRHRKINWRRILQSDED